MKKRKHLLLLLPLFLFTSYISYIKIIEIHNQNKSICYKIDDWISNDDNSKKKHLVKIETKQFDKDKETLNEIINRYRKKEVTATISNYQNGQYLLKRAGWTVNIPVYQFEPFHRKLSETFSNILYNHDVYDELKEQKAPITTIITLREVSPQLVN